VDRKEGEPHLESSSQAPLADERKKRQEPEGMAAKPVGESRSGAATRVQAGLSVNDFISKTKNQQRQGLKPSGPELIAYARYLGIDPVADHDLLWIAVEALEAPLPSDWTEHFDSSDRVFYYNASTRVSSWTHPLEHVYRETYKTIVNLRNSNMSAQERGDALSKLQAEVRQMDQETQKEVAKWSEHQDEQGNRFYFNKEERQSTWTDPRPAKCQVLYLKMKMLRLLLSSSAGTPGFVDPSKDASSSRYGIFGASSEYSDSQVKSSKEKKPAAGASDEIIDLSKDADEKTSPRSDQASQNGSDSDSDGKKKKKKKKKDKKEKKSKKLKDDKFAGPDMELGARPPTVSAAASSSNATVPSSTEDNPGFGEHGEAAGKGHVKVKAGIRLEPLSSLNQGSPSSSPMDRVPEARLGGLRPVP